MRVTDVAKALKVEMPLITTMVQGLAAGGLLESVAHSRDRRAKMLLLTPAGRDRVDAVENALSDHLQGYRQQFSSEDLDTYFGLLEKFTEMPLPGQSS